MSVKIGGRQWEFKRVNESQVRRGPGGDMIDSAAQIDPDRSEVRVTSKVSPHFQIQAAAAAAAAIAEGSIICDDPVTMESFLLSLNRANCRG